MTRCLPVSLVVLPRQVGWLTRTTLLATLTWLLAFQPGQAAPPAVAPAQELLRAASNNDPKERGVGTTYQVPYRLSDTNHFLVRVRINGRGPSNFLVDTGAPIVVVSTETAKKIGLEPSKTSFWTTINRIDFEGGPFLENLPCRIEDPYQLVGMNAMGLPGVSIDGILGFTALARFRITMDPTTDRMIWTRLDFEPRDPFVSAGVERPREVPAELKVMEAFGPMMKLMSVFTGKQPEEKRLERGSLGLELADSSSPLTITAVWPDSPAQAAGIQPGDRLLEINNQRVADFDAARRALDPIRPNSHVTLKLQRGDQTLDLELQATRGF